MISANRNRPSLFATSLGWRVCVGTALAASLLVTACGSSARAATGHDATTAPTSTTTAADATFCRLAVTITEGFSLDAILGKSATLENIKSTTDSFDQSIRQAKAAAPAAVAGDMSVMATTFDQITHLIDSATSLDDLRKRVVPAAAKVFADSKAEADGVKVDGYRSSHCAG